MPRLPKRTYSAFGDITVSRRKGDCPDDALGVFKPNKRHIAIHPKTHDKLVWTTFWHESAHVALWESGVANVLTEEQNEAVADAIGQYLSGMMKAGMLKIISPE